MPTSSEPGYRIKPSPTGGCTDSKLGNWLAETGGSFHPSLVFRDHQNGIASSTSDMGMAIHANRTIEKRQVLATCSLEAIISRQSCLERIAKLFEQEPFRNQDQGNPKTFHDFNAHWLDRTVISFYLLLTKLSLASLNPEPRERKAPVALRCR